LVSKISVRRRKVIVLFFGRSSVQVDKGTPEKALSGICCSPGALSFKFKVTYFGTSFSEQ
jgi:hypothetical protein